MAPAFPSTDTARRIVIIGFDHMHAGDQIVAISGLPSATLAGVWDTDSERMNSVCDDLGVADQIRYTDLGRLVADTAPELAVVCSSTQDHRRHVEYFAERGIHVLLEKPFAASWADAQAMAAAATAGNIQLGVNWPLAWYPVHRTTQRLIADHAIGDVLEVHYYDGNRGPLFHTHGKKETDPAVIATAKAAAWWYDADKGGGSLRDYLGYGTTLATWFRAGELPTDVTARTHQAPGDSVDEQSVVIAAYESGLSTFQTKWGTFTDPWVAQPFPRCGFVIVGSEGTIASFDYAPSVLLQDIDHPEGVEIPVDDRRPADAGGIAHILAALAHGVPLTGPISLQTSLDGQRIVEAAVTSAATGRPMRLDESSE